jgi:hypothetical protein
MAVAPNVTDAVACAWAVALMDASPCSAVVSWADAVAVADAVVDATV